MGRLTQWDFDIAMMKLQEPVAYSSVVSPICLPPQGMNFATIGAKGWVYIISNIIQNILIILNYLKGYWMG